MQNIIKTLMSGFKTLIDNKIRKSVADWNQNDTDAVNYVKNRTHWKEETIIFHVENLTESMYNNNEIPQCNFIPGNTYSVLWNGTLYDNLVCYIHDGYNVIADELLGCPFYIDDDGGNAFMVSLLY